MRTRSRLGPCATFFVATVMIGCSGGTGPAGNGTQSNGGSGGATGAGTDAATGSPGTGGRARRPSSNGGSQTGSDAGNQPPPQTDGASAGGSTGSRFNDPPPVTTPGGSEPFEGFGATTPGGAQGAEIHITEATDKAVRDAFNTAASGNVKIIFDVTGPFKINSRLPILAGANITIEGNGAMLDGDGTADSGADGALVEIGGHDVIVENLRLRNGYDNLRAQGDGAYNIVFSHISTTGSNDDGISIGYGAHDITVEYCFFAGDSRSMFMKYGATDRVSLHHSWFMKQGIRGPLVSEGATTGLLADIRNILNEDWSMWGTSYELGARGNVINSLWVLHPNMQSGDRVQKAMQLRSSPGPVYISGATVRGADPAATGTAPDPFDVPAVNTMSVVEMEPYVRAHAGSMPRDTVDQAYIDWTGTWTIDVNGGHGFRLR